MWQCYEMKNYKISMKTQIFPVSSFQVGTPDFKCGSCIYCSTVIKIRKCVNYN